MRLQCDEILEIIAKDKKVDVKTLFLTYDHGLNIFYIEQINKEENKLSSS